MFFPEPWFGWEFSALRVVFSKFSSQIPPKFSQNYQKVPSIDSHISKKIPHQMKEIRIQKIRWKETIKTKKSSGGHLKNSMTLNRTFLEKIELEVWLKVTLFQSAEFSESRNWWFANFPNQIFDIVRFFSGSMASSQHIGCIEVTVLSMGVCAFLFTIWDLLRSNFSVYSSNFSEGVNQPNPSNQLS